VEEATVEAPAEAVEATAVPVAPLAPEVPAAAAEKATIAGSSADYSPFPHGLQPQAAAPQQAHFNTPNQQHGLPVGQCWQVGQMPCGTPILQPAALAWGQPFITNGIYYAAIGPVMHEGVPRMIYAACGPWVPAAYPSFQPRPFPAPTPAYHHQGPAYGQGGAGWNQQRSVGRTGSQQQQGRPQAANAYHGKGPQGRGGRQHRNRCGAAGK
jgi:hypothetical protein